jgi:hypothetical protein
MAPTLSWAFVNAAPVDVELEELVDAVLGAVAVPDPVEVGVEPRMEETLMDTGLPDCWQALV